MFLWESYIVSLMHVPHVSIYIYAFQESLILFPPVMVLCLNYASGLVRVTVSEYLGVCVGCGPSTLIRLRFGMSPAW